MALETRIPKEITEYREKIVFGLSGRQLISVAAALAVVGATGFLLWYVLGINFSIVEYILILEAMPIVAFGFVRKDGMPLENYLLILFRYNFGNKKLPNKTELDSLQSLYGIDPRAKANSSQHSDDPERKKHHVIPSKAERQKRKERRKQRECLQQKTKRFHLQRRPRAKKA